jgi:hypothetical protein
VPKKHPKTDYRRYGQIFLYVGLACLVIALFINFVFIRPTDFKAQFRHNQYAECLHNGSSAQICNEHFGEKTNNQ